MVLWNEKNVSTKYQNSTQQDSVTDNGCVKKNRSISEMFLSNYVMTSLKVARISIKYT